jgi:hypothetical protein
MIAFVEVGVAMLCPPGLGGVSESLASFFSAYVAPARGAEAKGLPFYWRRREFSTCDVEQLQREIEQDLRWKSGLSHDAAKRHRSSDTQTCRQF